MKALEKEVGALRTEVTAGFSDLHGKVGALDIKIDTLITQEARRSGAEQAQRTHEDKAEKRASWMTPLALNLLVALVSAALVAGALMAAYGAARGQ